MRTDFRKSFARDLRRRKNDSDFLDRVKEAIEDVELAETTFRITNLKKLKGKVIIIGFALGITELA